MNKIIIDVLIVLGVILCYVLLGALQGFMGDIITTGNASIAWTGMESSQKAYNAMPLIVWFIPGIVGIVAIIVNHKLRKE